MRIRTYSELIRIPSYEERFRYLQMAGKIGERTFGGDRYLNQILYHSDFWHELRDTIIIRDEAMDMAMPGYPIRDRVIVHHITPITLEDVEEMTDRVRDPENLVCVSLTTHNAIHYGDEGLLPKGPIERKPWDTCPWRS